MQLKNSTNWKYDSSLDCLLFFAQRVDELLFHHTTDTYRFPSLSLRGLAKEFCDVYIDALHGVINSKNLPLIIDEFNERLQADPLAKSILSEEYVIRFQKNYGSWGEKTQFENITYIGRKLSNRIYYNAAVKEIKGLVVENRKKKDIDSLAKIWVREAIDCGYDENYLYKTLHKVFFHDEVSSLDSLSSFFSAFDFKRKSFDVYIGFAQDLSPIKALFEKIVLADGALTVMSPNEVPVGIKTKYQKTILKFESVKALDLFSAYEKAFYIASHVIDSYAFFRHDGSTIKTYGQVVCADKSIASIKQSQLLKHRASAQSRIDSERNADMLLSALFSNIPNREDLRRIIRIHNSALRSESTNDSLLSLWSLAESLVDVDNTVTKENADTKAKEDAQRYKSGNVIDIMIPFQKSTYVSKLVQTLISDIKHWDATFFDELVMSIEFGDNELEKTFAFLAFDSTQTIREELYKRTDLYPLLRNRVVTLNEQFHNSKHIKACIAEHEKRIRWHIQRIYRARNYIIHDGASNDEMNYDLLIDLHFYIDTVVSKIVELINASPYNDTVSDVISEHKIEVSILDEMLDKQENEKICESNARKYLYYDYRI